MEQLPHQVPPLKFTEATSIITTLKQLPRTGWLQWKIPQPETVYDHILAVRELAVQYQTGLELSDCELDELLDMLEIHDWPEALVGDGVILGDEENVDELRMSKQQREMMAMQEICADLSKGQYIMALYERYATGADKIARLAKEIEKFQAVLVAQKYEERYQKSGLLAEFVFYTKDLIYHPFLKTEFHKIAATVSALLLYMAVPAQHYASNLLKFVGGMVSMALTVGVR